MLTMPDRPADRGYEPRITGNINFNRTIVNMTDFSSLRRTMVDTQLRTNKITDERILTSMLEIPRELFVPEEKAPLAYIDEDIQLSGGRCLPEPMIIARLIQMAKISSDDVVLDVACATGYSSAVVGRIATAVVALDSHAELAAAATKNLASLGLDNVVVETGPIEAGWPDQAPFDVILINGACEKVPDALLEQLSDPGRLCAIDCGGDGPGVARIWNKTDAVVSSRVVFDANVPRLPEFNRPRSFSFQ